MVNSPLRVASVLTLAASLIAACDTSEPDQETASPWLLGLHMAPATTPISDSLHSLYWEDATRLAIRRIHELADYGIVQAAEPVDVPPELVRFFFDGLMHAYAATALPHRDSVFTLAPSLQIHTFRAPDLHHLILSADTTEAWVRAWRDGAIRSGNAVLDSLTERYDLAVSVEYTYGGRSTFTLEAREPLNLRPMSETLRSVAGVQFAYVDSAIGDGSDLTASVEPTGVGYRFELGWGDCPSGCIHAHVWTFVVSYDGSVRSGRSYGASVPAAFYRP